jgi:hypothetical protein
MASDNCNGSSGGTTAISAKTLEKLKRDGRKLA